MKTKNNYELVKEIIESYEMDSILNEFVKVFKVGENIEYKDYYNFCMKYVDDMSEVYYIKLNWKYINSGGDESVYDES